MPNYVLRIGQRDHLLNVGPGPLLLTGAAAGLLLDSVLLEQSGVFALSGSDAVLQYGLEPLFEALWDYKLGNDDDALLIGPVGNRVFDQNIPGGEPNLLMVIGPSGEDVPGGYNALRVNMYTWGESHLIKRTPAWDYSRDPEEEYPRDFVVSWNFKTQVEDCNHGHNIQGSEWYYHHNWATFLEGPLWVGICTADSQQDWPFGAWWPYSDVTGPNPPSWLITFDHWYNYQYLFKFSENGFRAFPRVYDLSDGQLKTEFTKWGHYNFDGISQGDDTLETYYDFGDAERWFDYTEASDRFDGMCVGNNGDPQAKYPGQYWFYSRVQVFDGTEMAHDDDGPWVPLTM